MNQDAGILLSFILIFIGVIYNVVWAGNIRDKRDRLREREISLDEYSGQLDDWAREVKVARINVHNLVMHAERYAAGHEATRAMFNRIVERLHEKLPEEEAEDGGD